MPDDVLETLEDLSDDDLVVIVTRATSKDVTPFGRAVEVVKAHTNAKIAYVVNQGDRYSMAKQFTEWFKEGVKYNNAAFIRASEKVRQAEALRKSIFEHDKRRECVATPGMQEMVQMVRRNLDLPADDTI